MLRALYSRQREGSYQSRRKCSPDGAGVLYLGCFSSSICTYDTVTGTVGSIPVPWTKYENDFQETVTIDGMGDLFSIELLSNNGTIEELKADGTSSSTTLNPELLQPSQITTDAAGNVFVGGYSINELTTAGVQTQVNKLGASEGVAVDASETLYATRYDLPSEGFGVAELPPASYSTANGFLDKTGEIGEPLGIGLGSDGTLGVGVYGNYDIVNRTKGAISFQTAAIGATVTETADIRNIGNKPLTITSVNLSGDGYTLATGSGDCAANTVLAAGELCNLVLTWSPTHPGDFPGTVTVVSDSLGVSTTQIITLTGHVDGAYLTASPAAVNFGSQAENTTSAAKTITLTNVGNYPARVTGITSSDPAFTFTASNCESSNIAASSSCQMTVTFSPTTPTSYSAILSVTSSTVGTSTSAETTTIALTGTGTGPQIPVVSLTPTTLAFGNQYVGFPSSTQTATLSNTGSGPLTISSIVLGGVNLSSFAESTTCGSSLAAGATCQISATFTPTVTGTLSATVTVTDNASGSPHKLTLSGTGIVVPVATLSPASLNFGSHPAGSTSSAMTLTLSNPSSTTALNFDSISISGAGSASFAQTSNCGISIAANSSCSLSVTFTPATVGSLSATLSIVTRYSGFGPVSVSGALSGTGTAPPTPTFTPSTLAFGNQIVNTSASLTTILTNVGTGTLVIDGALPNIVGTGAAAISASSNCPSTLAPAATCSASATFTPANVGAYSLSLQLKVHYSSAPSIELTPTAAITGTGIAQPPVLTITPSPVNFGNQPVNITSPPRFVTLTNSSTTDTVTVASIELDGSTPFLLSSSNCFSQLAPGASCTVSAVFDPGAAQSYNTSAIVHVQPSPACGVCASTYPPQPIALTGTGFVPVSVLAISPFVLDFGNQPVNTRSASRSVTVTNTSKTDTIDIYEFDGGLGFDVDINSCPGSLAPGASCTVDYTFVPTAYTEYTSVATIKARPDACFSGACFNTYAPASFDLVGTGTLPLSYLTPGSMNFTATSGTTSAPQTAVIENFRDAVYAVYGVSIAGMNPNDFHQTNNCGLFLTIGSDCTLSVTFTPTSPGVKTATLEILSNDPTSPQIVSLNGFAAESRFTPLIDFGQGFTPQALTLSGPAAITGGALQLTSGPSSAASSAFYPTPVPTKSFDTAVSFQLLDPTAEGITFTIQGDGPNTAGSGGGGLGYQGLQKSIAVKFDLKDSAGEGIDSTGIYVNGAAPTVPAVSLTSSGIDLHSGHVFALHLSYDGTTMSVSLTDTLTLAVWTTTAAEDIPDIVGGDTAYFGFTAGSGALALTSDSIRLARPAITTTDGPQPPATSNILTWIYVANGETKTTQTISFPPLPGVTYGRTPVVLAATATSALPVSYTVSGPAKLSGAMLTIIGAGQVVVTASQSGNASFAPAAPVTQSFAVAKASLTVTANDLSRAVGTSNPPLTYAFSGFVEGDTASSVSGTAVLGTAAVLASPSGKYPIIFSTKELTAANYSFNYVPGTLTLTSVACQTIDYSSGFTSSGLSLNGGASINGSALELTDGGLFEARSAFFSAPLPTTSFATDFTFQITDPVADGITFIIQSNNARVIGQPGGGLGYAGIPHSVAIKADLHNNAGEGTDSTGIYMDGAEPSTPAIDLRQAGIDLHSGHIFAGHVAYANGLTKATIQDTVTGVSASMNFPVNIPQVIGNNAWFGFTAGTGAHSATQKILTWSYSGGAGCSTK